MVYPTRTSLTACIVFLFIVDRVGKTACVPVVERSYWHRITREDSARASRGNDRRIGTVVESVVAIRFVSLLFVSFREHGRLYSSFHVAGACHRITEPSAVSLFSFGFRYQFCFSFLFCSVLFSNGSSRYPFSVGGSTGERLENFASVRGRIAIEFTSCSIEYRHTHTPAYIKPNCQELSDAPMAMLLYQPCITGDESSDHIVKVRVVHGETGMHATLVIPWHLRANRGRFQPVGYFFPFFIFTQFRRSVLFLYFFLFSFFFFSRFSFLPYAFDGLNARRRLILYLSFSFVPLFPLCVLCVSFCCILGFVSFQLSLVSSARSKVP